MIKIPIKTEFIKLDSFLKFCGISVTGGEGKKMITDGQIFVNGEVCTARGKKLYPGTTIFADEKEYLIVPENDNK